MQINLHRYGCNRFVHVAAIKILHTYVTLTGKHKFYLEIFSLSGYFYNHVVWSLKFHINGVEILFNVKQKSWAALTLFIPNLVNGHPLALHETSSHISCSCCHSFNSQPTLGKNKLEIQEVFLASKTETKYSLPYFVFHSMNL